MWWMSMTTPESNDVKTYMCLFHVWTPKCSCMCFILLQNAPRWVFVIENSVYMAACRRWFFFPWGLCAACASKHKHMGVAGLWQMDVGDSWWTPCQRERFAVTCKRPSHTMEIRVHTSIGNVLPLPHGTSLSKARMSLPFYSSSLFYLWKRNEFTPRNKNRHFVMSWSHVYNISISRTS